MRKIDLAMDNYASLALAAQGKKQEKPSPEAVVKELLAAEKTARKEKKTYSFSQLEGKWRLTFITGTKNTRQKAGVVLGAGRYLPGWVKIFLTYSSRTSNQENFTPGRVENLVQLGGLNLALSGPVKFLARKNLLVFDFTHLKVSLGQFTLYSGNIRGNTTQEEFDQTSISKQAFFAYFLVREEFIAARGKGGGLAIWAKT